MRLMEMESRVLGLEDRLSRALDEVREARTREMNVVSLLRDIIGHLASVEKGEQWPRPGAQRQSRRRRR
jgi:osomolarity two-component system response regulator SKN7